MESQGLIGLIIGAIFASCGFWAFITAVYNNRSKKQTALIKLILGIGHREIVECGKEYIERGYITYDEYEDLIHYLYDPYVELGGNGSAEKVMQEIKKLPMKEK